MKVITRLEFEHAYNDSAVLHTHNIRMCEIDIGNPKYTRNTLRLLSSGTKLFITFELRVFRHEERETQSFYADCFYIISSQSNQRTAPVAHKFVWPRPVLNPDSLVLKSQKSSAHSSGAWRHSHPLVSFFYLGFLFWHLWMTHPLLVRANTCVNVAPN